MIEGNCDRLGSFKALMRSLLAPDVGGRVIGGTMTATDTEGLVEEFESTWVFRPECRDPVWRCRLVFEDMPEDFGPGEQAAVAREVLEKIGLVEFPWALFRAEGAEPAIAENVVEIVATRIGEDGSFWNEREEQALLDRALEEIGQSLAEATAMAGDAPAMG